MTEMPPPGKPGGWTPPGWTPADGPPDTGQLPVTEADGEQQWSEDGTQLRSKLHAKNDVWYRKHMLPLGAAAVVLLAGIGVGAFMLASSGTASSTPPPATHTTTTPPPTTVVPVTTPRKVNPACPLTDLPPPGGKVPQRPVLAVKVGNDPAARPQSGLQDADIVFDTLAEGGITRYIAVYQCNTATAIGPIRSVRWDDWHILQQFGHADLSFVHGIDPDVNTVAGLSWVCDLDAFAHFNLYQTDPSRVAPEATYSSTASLWSGCPKAPAPPRIFHFSARPPATASAVASVEIPYSYAADVVWEWSAAHKAFMHNYRNGGVVEPDIDDIGQQLQAKNVVIEVVSLQYGPYEETPGSTGDVESITEGSGVAYVLRNGTIQVGRWVRPTWSDITKLIGSDGQPMSLTPGNTWVEIVPNTDSITIKH